MNYDYYLNQIDPKIKKNIKVNLNNFSNHNITYKKVIVNIFLEYSLVKDDWDELSDEICKKLRLTEIATIISKFCRNNRNLLGEPAKINSNVYFGRIIEFERFCQLLVKNKFYSDFKEAKSNLRYRLGLDPSKMEKRWNSIELGNHIMWCTFNPKGGSPFETPLPSPNEISCSLGLEPPSTPLLIIEYKLPVNIKPKIPTFCDAYSSNNFPKYFMRVLKGSPYGITEPTEYCDNILGKPEVVHEIITAENIVSPLKFA